MLCPAAPVMLRDEIIDALSKDMEEPINDQENIEFFVGFKMDGVTTDEDDMDANEIDVFTDPVFDPNITIPYRPFWPFSETEIVLKVCLNFSGNPIPATSPVDPHFPLHARRGGCNVFAFTKISLHYYNISNQWSTTGLGTVSKIP